MLLRASSEHTGETYDFRSVNGEAAADSGIPSAEMLIDFAQAVLGTDATHLAQARHQVQTRLGSAVLVDSAAVVAIFNAVVRIADATGIPLEAYKIPLTADLRAELGIDDFPSAQG